MMHHLLLFNSSRHRALAHVNSVFILRWQLNAMLTLTAMYAALASKASEATFRA